jgi:hypothetical protein
VPVARWASSVSESAFAAMGPRIAPAKVAARERMLVVPVDVSRGAPSTSAIPGPDTGCLNKSCQAEPGRSGIEP